MKQGCLRSYWVSWLLLLSVFTKLLSCISILELSYRCCTTTYEVIKVIKSWYYNVFYSGPKQVFFLYSGNDQIYVSGVFSQSVLWLLCAWVTNKSKQLRAKYSSVLARSLNDIDTGQMNRRTDHGRGATRKQLPKRGPLIICIATDDKNQIIHLILRYELKYISSGCNANQCVANCLLSRR